MKMNKKVAGILLAAMSTMIFTGCGSSESEKKADAPAAGSKIVVISREDGSGTRGAFIELFGIEKKDANGKKIDHTTDSAAITNNTSVMMTTVAGNKDAIHKYFYGDELRLKQILTNLLSNAYKFTENGGMITVTVAEKVTENDSSEVFFSVRDTGVGIPESDMERIFGSFEQVLSKSRNNQQGTGLGLTISKSLVQLMGGVLKVQSEVGAGSEFFFILTLPVYTGEITEELEDTTLPQEHDLLQGKSILLAEDNALNAEIAVALLEMQGVIVECVENGQQAVERFASQPLGAYDLILMDLQMPVKNGLEAAMEIRALDRADAQKIPIIAMTANTMQEDREKARGVGMNGFIPKPFDVEQLYKSVECFFTEKK